MAGDPVQADCPHGASAAWSAAYWEARYAAGGHSGSGSRGRLLAYKAAFLQKFLDANDVDSVIDLGCGDGVLLARLQPRRYLGIDVSATILARLAATYAGREKIGFLPYARLGEAPAAEVALSVDVLFHLVEDSVFTSYLDGLFAHATRFVVIYASNHDATWPAAHVRHRRFTASITPERFPGWRLAAHVPNPHPFDPARPDDTSFADFFVFSRDGQSCTLRLPAWDALTPRD